MKNTESNGISWSTAAAIAFILLAGVGGHLKGKADTIADARSGARAVSGLDTAGEEDPVGRKSDSSDALRLDRIHKRLFEIWKSPTSGGYDPEAEARTSHLLEQMSSAEIEGFLRTLPPGSADHAYEMTRSILFAWGMQDAPSALAYLSTCDSTRMTISLVERWVLDQPDAALAWMDGGSLTLVQKRQMRDMRLQSLLGLSNSDPDRAFKELSNMKHEDAADQIWLWSISHAQDPQMRQRLLDYAAASGNPEDLASVRSSIAGSLARADPDAAKEFVRNLKIGDEDAAELDAAVTVGAAYDDPEAAYSDWVQRNPGVMDVPATLQNGFSEWMDDDPDRAIKWLKTLPAGGLRDRLYESSIPALAGSEHFDEAAGIVKTIDSPSLRAEALNALQTRWLLVDSQKAAAWKDGLPAEDQALLRK
jgi:hypothetical protein